MPAEAPACRRGHSAYAAVRRAGDGLDLDEEFGQKQSGHAHERARRPAFSLEELIADGANGYDLGNVDDEECELDDVRPVGAGGREGPSAV